MVALITLIILYSIYLSAGLLITGSVYLLFRPLLDRRARHRRSLRGRITTTPVGIVLVDDVPADEACVASVRFPHIPLLHGEPLAPGPAGVGPADRGDVCKVLSEG